MYATQMGRHKGKITASLSSNIRFLNSPQFFNDIYFIRPPTPRLSRRRGSLLI